MKMDILKPELVWIENRCYRKLNINYDKKETYVEDDIYPTQPYEYNNEDEEDESECLNLDIKYENEKFWTSLPVPGPLIGYVCGKFSQNIKRIENTTGAQVKIPGRMAPNGPDRRRKIETSSDFVITAEKKTSVEEAYKRLREIMISGRWRVAEFTHFVSIPVNSDSIQERFLKFKQEVLKACHSVRGVNEAVFTPPSKLHLTLTMLTLLDDREKEEAKAALKECHNLIMKMLGGRSLRLLIKGVEYMNDDYAEVDVLYGQVAETGGGNVLQIIAEKLAEKFSSIHFAPPEYCVKLHVTLLKSRGDQEGRNSFDARPILEKFKDYTFGEIGLTEVHISTRHTGHDKYYTPLAVINL